MGKSPIVFRASFEQPKGALNPSGWRMPGPQWVEVYQDRVSPLERWCAREPRTRIRFFQIAEQASAAILKAQIGVVFFERQLSPWVAVDTMQIPARELTESDWASDPDGKVYLTESYSDKLRAERGAKGDA